MQKYLKSRKASSLPAVLIIFSVILVIINYFVQTGISNAELCRLKLEQIQAFYLSESGVEHGKSKIASSSDWFTDENPVSLNKAYLLFACTGERYVFGSGGYKIIRPKNKNELYSIGFLGDDITKSRAFSFQRIEFELPYRQNKWQEL